MAARFLTMEIETSVRPEKDDFAQAWTAIEGSVNKLLTVSNDPYAPSDCIAIYTQIYNCLTRPEPQAEDSASAFSNKYKEVVESYILQFFAIEFERDRLVVFSDFLKEWKAFKTFVQRISHAFNYLDRFYNKKRNLPELRQVAMECFDALVFQKAKGFLKEIILDEVDRNRRGEEVDTALLRNAIHIFLDVYMGRMDKFEEELEAAILRRADAFYAHKILAMLCVKESDDEKGRGCSEALLALEQDAKLAADFCMPERSRRKLLKKILDVIESTELKEAASESLVRKYSDFIDSTMHDSECADPLAKQVLASNMFSRKCSLGYTSNQIRKKDDL